MTGDEHARSDVVDWDRSTWLGNGYRAAVAIDPNGETRLWIVGPDADEHHTGNAGPQAAPHEQPGPLPTPYRYRLHAVTYRCGAPTLTTGAPCRTPVYQPGDRCGHHRHQEAR